MDYKEINRLVAKYIRERNNPNAISKEFREALINAEEALNIRSGWWVSADDRFVICYDTKEEAIAHVKYQKERMHSTENWHVQYIKVEFKEYLTF